MCNMASQQAPVCSENQARFWQVTPGRSLVLAALVYVGFTSWLSIRRHNGFVDVGDTHIFENMLWNTCHGEFLRWGMVGINALGDHMSPTLFLLAPAYALYQHPVTLILVQRALLAGSAIVVFHCANRVLGSARAAWMLALAYLVCPAQHGLNMASFTPMCLSVPLLMWLFCCYEARQMRWLWVALLLSLGVKENMPLVVAAFGLYIAVFRRDVKLGVTVMAIATVWFVLALRVLIPYLAGTSFDTLYIRRYYGPTVGATFGEVVSFPLRHPLRAVGIAFGQDQRWHLLRLLGPTGFVALAAPDVLLPAVPTLLQSLFATSAYGMCSTLTHHHATVVPGVMYAVMHGIRRIAHIAAARCQWQPCRVSGYLSTAVLACCAICLPFSNTLQLQIRQSWENSFEAPMMSPARRVVARRLMARVPPRAVVACPLNLANHMAGRPTLYSNVRNLTLQQGSTPGGTIPPAAWVLLDMKLGAIEGLHQAVQDLSRLEAVLAESYQCVEREAFFVLLRRCKAAPPTSAFRFTQEEAEVYWQATYRRALGCHQTKPQRADLLRDVACVLYEGGQTHLAVELLEKAIPVAEPKAYVFVLLGICYRDIGRSDKAIEAWQQALRLDPDHSRAKELLDEMAIGQGSLGTPMP